MDIKVEASTDPGLTGLSGRIVDETRNTLVLDTNGTERRVAKDVVTLRFTNEQLTIPGTALMGRPDDRIKRKVRL